jgi:hypothetical protein
MPQLIDSELNASLNGLIGKSNDLNRLADRIMSLLSSKWFMKNASKLLHPRIAHYYSLVFSDKIGEYQDQRGMLTEYPGTADDIGRVDFYFPFDAMNELLLQTLELETMIGDSIAKACDAEDFTTKQFLNEMLQNLIPIVDQLQVLCDILQVVGTTPTGWMSFDYNIQTYISVPIAGG